MAMLPARRRAEPVLREDAAAGQAAIFALSGSVALLADLIHNAGDALTAIPLGIVFFLRSFRGEKFAGRAVVFLIFVSACVALFETVMRIIHPQNLASAIIVAFGFERGDPIIGLVILRITWDAWRTVSTTDPGEMHEH